MSHLRALARFMGERSSWSGEPKTDEPPMPAGFVYFGQLVAHDLLAKLRNPVKPGVLGAPSPPHRLDLRCIYGEPPYKESGLFDERGRFRLGSTAGRDGLPNDLVLDAAGEPLAAAPRNDSNLILSQLHVAFLHLHNAVLDRGLVAASLPAEERVARARAVAAWHYQAVILDDYLPGLCDPQQLDLVRRRAARRVFDREATRFIDREVSRQIPAAFRFAAFRYGHSQIDDYYDLNDAYTRGGRTASPMPLAGILRHRGYGPTPAAIPTKQVLDWRRFFPFPDTDVPLNASRPIDPRLAEPLFRLPSRALADKPEENDVSLRDLRHQISEHLPTGQEMAAYLGLEVLEGEERIGLRIADSGRRSGRERPRKALNDRLNRHTPLWYYILAEAAHQQQGRRLGQIGTRVVAETLYCLLENNPDSPLHRPAPPRCITGCEERPVEMWRLLEFAGVVNPRARVPAARDD